MRPIKLTALAAFTSMAAACSGGGTVDIGRTAGAKLSDYAASWDGYAEAYAFDSTGSDRVRLTLDENGQGTVRFGDADLLAPPTDPNAGYPPGYDPAIVDVNNPSPSLPAVGFAYPVVNTSVESSRIRLDADTRELFRGWCAIQPPVANDGFSTGYGCVANLGFGGDAGGCYQVASDGTTHVAIDCDKLGLCMNQTLCSCTASACSLAPLAADYGIQLDGALEMASGDLVGTLVLHGTRVTVRLQRN
jgi:hypothetical protein